MSKEAILSEIRESQTKKKAIKMYKVLSPEKQSYIDMEKLRNEAWNGIAQTIPS